ncbi:MAG: hypothetical protein AUG74_14920 [Bacteroidetes bacterium 13_1_20CM_4_60_6]|nr:MAG: hypothetical protein AUG74_14920 [Bacteroidetes bacterium 13_1_20CM_4_60_6]
MGDLGHICGEGSGRESKKRSMMLSLQRYNSWKMDLTGFVQKTLIKVLFCFIFRQFGIHYEVS